MMRRVVVGLIVLAVITGIVWLFLRPAVPAAGETFAKQGELDQRMKALGYAEMGRFNPTWPATILSVQQADDAITFAVPGNSSHIYEDPAYVGYRFIAFTMQSTRSAQPFVMLYKSNEKR